jgi:hypothetical protein
MIAGKFPLVYGIKFFQNIGKYSKVNFVKPKNLNCSARIINNAIKDIATLKLISEEGILYASHIVNSAHGINAPRIGATKSFIIPAKFENRIIKNNKVI